LVTVKSNQKTLHKELVTYFDHYWENFDEDSSESEEKFILLGVSNESSVLIVCHCERQDGEIIRIISARQATKNERKFYEGNLS
jgi:uncharacterized DUF497 family protein